MKLKKIFSLGLAAAMTASLLAGCGSGNPASSTTAATAGDRQIRQPHRQSRQQRGNRVFSTATAALLSFSRHRGSILVHTHITKPCTHI